MTPCRKASDLCRCYLMMRIVFDRRLRWHSCSVITFLHNAWRKADICISEERAKFSCWFVHSSAWANLKKVRKRYDANPTSTHHCSQKSWPRKDCEHIYFEVFWYPYYFWAVALTKYYATWPICRHAWSGHDAIIDCQANQWYGKTVVQRRRLIRNLGGTLPALHRKP